MRQRSQRRLDPQPRNRSTIEPVMTRNFRMHRAETAARWFGRLVRQLTLRNGRATRIGRTPVAARVLLWAVGLAILIALLLVTFWLALVVLCVLIAVKLLPHIGQSSDPDDPEWRQGLLGFGLYDHKGFRIDPHDPSREP